MVLINKLMFVLLAICMHGALNAAITEQNTSSISPESLQNFSENQAAVQKIILKGLDLATKKLGYQYGSASPANQGMDCSGVIYYLLTDYGLKDIPRSSKLLYQWTQKKGKFYPAAGDFNSPDFVNLKPGDLLFWSNTYETAKPDNASHTMIYLGKNLQGDRLMLGSSDGRTYQEKKVYGVSVFDFDLPTINSKSKFLGYSCIPEISC